MKKKYIFPLLAFGFTMASCVEDEGNYNYTDINDVEISGIEESYSPKSRYDTLTIRPELKGTVFGDDLDSYEYKWTLCNESHTHDVICTEKDLVDWPVDITPGSYVLYFTVKDRATGLEKIESTNLTVSASYTRGFLMLGDDPKTGYARLDMLSMPPDRDTLMFEDVMKEGEVLPLTGARKIIYGGQAAVEDYEHLPLLYAIGDNGAYRLNYFGNFTLRGEFNDLSIIEMSYPHAKPMRVHDVFPRQGSTLNNRTRTYRGYITDDVAVMALMVGSETFSEPVNRYSNYDSNLFKPYPLAFCPGALATGYDKFCMLYDMDNDKFVVISCATRKFYCIAFPPQNDTGAWKLDAGSEGRTIVYGENGFEQDRGYHYAIMKDKEGPNYYIYRFLTATSYFGITGVQVIKSPLYKVDLSKAVDFERASHYMFSSNRLAVLYSVGNKLYMYDYTSNKCVSQEFDGEITCLEAEYCSNYSLEEFFVATFDDTKGSGMVRKMRVPSNAQGEIFLPLEGQAWETSMRVEDIEWKQND